MNPNDEIRTKILQWFYNRNAEATSQYGKKGSAVKISDAKAGLKSNYSLTQQQVMANLTYLIDKGWINKSEVQKTIRVKGGSVPSTVTWYEISAPGIDKIEGESEFQQDNRFAGVNLSVSGVNVITLGDGNVVNAEFQGLREILDELKTHIVSSSEIEEPIKLDFVADVESIKDQLVKNSPNKTVIKKLWEQIEKVATIGGAVDLIRKIVPIIGGIIG